MPLAHNPDNYLYGKGRLYFKPVGGSGYLDFGNVPKFELNVEIEKTEHFSSRSGVRTKDKSFITEKKATGSFDLEEFNAENLNLAFLGDGVIAGTQAAGAIDAAEKTKVADQFIDLGKANLFVTKLFFADAADYAIGETVTGGTSDATAKVAWKGTGFLEVIDVDGVFEVGETVTSAANVAGEACTGVEKVSDVVVTDAAAATERYVLGTDYEIDAVGGLLRIFSAVDETKVYVSADYEQITTKAVRALAGDSVEGELLFIGDPAQGPKWRVQCWKTNLTIAGAAGFISEDVSTLPMEAEVLADTTSHPSEPFFRATLLGG